MGRFVVVGCSTVVPEGDSGGSAYFVEMDGVRALLDAGPAAVQGLVRLGLPWAELTHIAITHFHADHVGGLPGLFFSFRHGILPPRKSAPLEVLGPPGTGRLFERMSDALGDYFLDPGFPVRIREIPPGGAAELNAAVRLSAHETPHTEESLALRLDGSAAGIGYTGDTGPRPSLGAFFRELELLVCECSLTDDLVGDNHLSPARAAELARDAAPSRLLLTHVYPQVRAVHDVAALVREAGYGGEVEVARPGWSVELPGRPGAGGERAAGAARGGATEG